ncbi:site-specific DNA-methyltransferase [Spirosoma lituiforme]
MTITSTSERLDMASTDLVNHNIGALAALFPNCVTETPAGKAVDFDLLKQELNHQVIEGNKERYRLEWPGKREAIVTANLPTNKTLRPVREESVDFDNTGNLYIEGDNLEVLKLLQESYFGKIKMIYIDPPYNTGNDFVYKDNFTQESEEFKKESGQKDDYSQRLIANPDTSGRYHSDWLSMMYPRLKLARNLLSNDGIIFISIDENELNNLKIICDEIFGQVNFVEQIAWKNKYGSGALTKGFANVHEYILVYSKDILTSIAAPLSEDQKLEYKQKDEKFSVRGGYITQPLATTSKDERPNLRYPVHHQGVEIWPEKQWIWSEDRFLKAYNNNEIVINETNGNYSVRSKQYLKDENGNLRLGKPISLLNGPFNQEGTKEIKSYFSEVVFDFPKPTALLKYLLSFVINANEDKSFFVLDFFSGSAATADAIYQLNSEDGGDRKFILVQIPERTDEKSVAYKEKFETICEIGKERIRRSGKRIKEALDNRNSEQLDFSSKKEKDLDIGFRVYRLDESNMQDVYYRPQDYNQDQLEIFADNIKSDRSADDLLAQVMLDWGLPLSYKIDQFEIAGKQVFQVAKNSLMACFDDNIDETFAKQVAVYKPIRIVCRDKGFKNDTAKENVRQLLKQLSPETEMRVI